MVSDMTVRIFGFADDSIVDGPGLRFSVFVQGCRHNCEGCHNPDSHDVNGGTVYKVDDIKKMIDENPLIDGITLSGGEPFLQSKPLTALAKYAHEKGLNVMTYTGYTFEVLVDGADEENGWRGLLESSDLLVDGRFEIDKRSLDLNFKGSSNQRIIDVKKSLECGEIVLSEYN